VAFHKFITRVKCDHSLAGEKLYFLGKEIKISKTNFEVELIAGEPGEYSSKITISRVNISAKEVTLRIIPYLYVVNEKIYNKARENLALRILTDRSIIEEEIRNAFSKIEVRGRKQNYHLSIERLDLVESRENIKIWDIEYNISDIFPSEYEIGPFSIEKNKMVSKTEAQPLIIVDIDNIKVVQEHKYGEHIKIATILPKNSTIFFDEFYDKEYDKYLLRMEIVRKTPFVHRSVISNPRELHELDGALKKAFAYGPGKYEIKFFVKNKLLLKKTVTVYGVFLRERALFVGRPCRVHIFAESDVELKFGDADIPIEKVAEYYYICDLFPKREGEIELEIKVKGRIIFNKTCLVQRPIFKKAIPESLEEALEDKNTYGKLLVYDKQTDKFFENNQDFLKILGRLNNHPGLKGIIIHPLFAWNEDSKDILFRSIHMLHKKGKQFRILFISQPTLYGGAILSPKNAEKVDFVPLVQRTCEKCGKRKMVLVKNEEKIKILCANCEAINPGEKTFPIINLPEIFRCPECGRSWLLPYFSATSQNSKIVLTCPSCLTEIDYCYFTILEFERRLPDILIFSIKQTEWLRKNYTYLLEQKTLLCKSCGQTHPICLLFQIIDYEKVLEEIRYNWRTINEDISDLIEEKKKLRRRIKRLRRIKLLERIKESEDLKISQQLLKRAYLDKKIDASKLKELIETEQEILKKKKELETQLEYVSSSLLRKLIYLFMKILGLGKKEDELVMSKQKLESIAHQKEEWFIKIKEKLGIITENYKLKEEALNKLLAKSKCYYCGGEIGSPPPLLFLAITCHDSVLVSDELLSFTVRKIDFVNDFYLYNPLISNNN